MLSEEYRAKYISKMNWGQFWQSMLTDNLYPRLSVKDSKDMVQINLLALSTGCLRRERTSEQMNIKLWLYLNPLLLLLCSVLLSSLSLCKSFINMGCWKMKIRIFSKTVFTVTVFEIKLLNAASCCTLYILLIIYIYNGEPTQNLFYCSQPPFSNRI